MAPKFEPLELVSSPRIGIIDFVQETELGKMVPWEINGKVVGYVYERAISIVDEALIPYHRKINEVVPGD